MDKEKIIIILQKIWNNFYSSAFWQGFSVAIIVIILIYPFWYRWQNKNDIEVTVRETLKELKFTNNFPENNNNIKLKKLSTLQEKILSSLPNNSKEIMFQTLKTKLKIEQSILRKACLDLYANKYIDYNEIDRPDNYNGQIWSTQKGLKYLIDNKLK